MVLWSATRDGPALYGSQSHHCGGRDNPPFAHLGTSSFSVRNGKSQAPLDGRSFKCLMDWGRGRLFFWLESIPLTVFYATQFTRNTVSPCARECVFFFNLQMMILRLDSLTFGPLETFWQSVLSRNAFWLVPTAITKSIIAKLI